MIRGYKPKAPTEDDGPRPLQWGAALGAGLVAGLVLLILPRGSPWSTYTVEFWAIMGRTVPASIGLPPMLICAIHLAVSLFYGVILSSTVGGLTLGRAILVGGVLGLAIYVPEFFLVHFLIPALEENEGGVAFAHAVFGLIAAAAYHGLLRRKPQHAVSGEAQH